MQSVTLTWSYMYHPFIYYTKRHLVDVYVEMRIVSGTVRLREKKEIGEVVRHTEGTFRKRNEYEHGSTHAQASPAICKYSTRL